MDEARDIAEISEHLAPGAMLLRMRAMREMSVAHVTEQLKYAARQIEALEADDYDRLPGRTFVRGMIRSYAKLLGTDPEPILRAFDRRHIPAQPSVDLRAKRIPFPDGRAHATRLYLALTILVLVAVGAVLYEWKLGGPVAGELAGRQLPAQPSVAIQAAVTEAAPPVQLQAQSTLEATPQRETAGATDPQSESPSAPAASPSATTPSPSAAPTTLAARSTAPSARGAKRILLEFVRESWVEIKDRGGRTLLSQLNPGGTQKLIEGEPPFSLVIGNAASVRLRYNDEPVDLKPHVNLEVARLTLD